MLRWLRCLTVGRKRIVVTENDAVQDDELVLRRVLNQADIIDLSLPKPVQRIAFRPTDQDDTGISIFRSLFATPDEVANRGTNPKGYYIVELPVNELMAIGLEVVPDPRDDQPKGHSLIPKLNCLHDVFDKKQSKILQLKLAQIVNKNIISRLVYSPP